MSDLKSYLDTDGFLYRSCNPDELELLLAGQVTDLPRDSLVTRNIVSRLGLDSDKSWLPAGTLALAKVFAGGRQLIRIDPTNLSVGDYFTYSKDAADQVYLTAEYIAANMELVQP